MLCYSLDLQGQAINNRRVNAEGRFSDHRFATEFEEDSMELLVRHDPPQVNPGLSEVTTRPAPIGVLYSSGAVLFPAPTSNRANRRTTIFSPSFPIRSRTRSRIVSFGSLMNGCSSRTTAAAALARSPCSFSNSAHASDGTSSIET